MRTITTIAVALIVAAPCMAQVFPGISVEDAERAVKAAEAKAGDTADAEKPVETPVVEVPSKPEPEPVEATGPTKEQKDLAKKFKDSLGSNRAELAEIDRHVQPLLRGSFADFKDYATALVDYNIDNFARAGANLIKYTPPVNLADSNHHRNAIWTAMKGGESTLLGHYANCWAEFDDSQRTEEGIKRKARAAARYARSAAVKMRQSAGVGVWTTEGMIDRAGDLDNFADNCEASWVVAWNAAKKANETPWDCEAVLSYARALWVKNRLELNMRQRLVLKYIIANFPEHQRVRSGEVATLLAWNYTRTFQFDAAKKLMDKAISDYPTGDSGLRESRTAMANEQTRIERGLLNIR